MALLFTVFICAACGLVYELALVALGSYLIGNSVEQASIVLGVMVFAMGIGALAAKPLQARAAVSFAVIEMLLAILGGTSVLMLYAAFAWLNIYTVALVVTAGILGILIGAEIPLLMVMLQRIREQNPANAVADLFAADYVGALLGGLAFPFLLLPFFGQVQGALLVGAINAFAGLGLVFTVFRSQVSRRTLAILTAMATLVAACLTGCYLYADRFEALAMQQLYAHPIVYSERSAYQQIVITESVSPFDTADMRLYLNGDLQFSSVDEYRYHEALVHPALSGPRHSVLVLGGGDGLALREILRYPDVADVTLVELDPAITKLAANYPPLVKLNENSFADPRVTLINDDAFTWLRQQHETYDAIVIDMPDPDETATAKLYSVEFYVLAARLLNPTGKMSIQAGSPYFAPRSFWCVDTTVVKAGLATTPYHVEVPSFGDWGFLLAASNNKAPEIELNPPSPLRSLDAENARAATVFPPDQSRVKTPASTLMNPVILRYALEEWQSYD